MNTDFYAITNEGDNNLFWSNENGWVDTPTFDLFTREERETLSLPDEGRWVQVAWKGHAPQPPAEAQAVAVCGERPSESFGPKFTPEEWDRLGKLPPGTKLYIAPPSAPVGVELICQVYADAYHHGHHATVEGGYIDVLPVDRDTFWREQVEENYTEALAKQPAAVDEVNWRDMYRLQTAMRYMDNDAQLTKERAYRMADNDVAALELQQGGRSDDR